MMMKRLGQDVVECLTTQAGKVVVVMRVVAVAFVTQEGGLKERGTPMYEQHLRSSQ